MSDDQPGFSENPTLPFSVGNADHPSSTPGNHVLIGPYRVIAHLGDGGFGSVYLAEQTHPVRRRVAVKVLKSGMDSPTLLARFEAERQVLVMMDHPGVAKVFDAGVTAEGRPYVAMEYVQGQPISLFCESHHLNIDERVRLIVKVCNAVHHAHMKGIIHRDLKPGNILVEIIDDKPSPRVIDFGVAKAQDRSLADSGVVTEHGQIIGTPEYMPPEQARGEGSAVDIDIRADVYAIGAVLYELLTGATPFESISLRRAGYAEMLRVIEQQIPELPSRRVTTVRSVPITSTQHASTDSGHRARRVARELDWIVMRCLEKDRARRYESAAALGRDLERYLSDEPVEAGPPSLSYRAAKFIRRNKVPVLAAALCLVIALAAFALTAWALGRAINERSLARLEQTKAVQARDEAEAVTSFLTGILESVQPENAGREVTVRQILDDAAVRLEADSSSHLAAPLLAARVHITLGTSYLALGELAMAERHILSGLETRERLLGPDAALSLQARFNLAGVLFAQGRTDDAEEHYRRCLDTWSRSPEMAGADIAGALNNLAQIAVRGRRLDDAERLQRRAIAEMEARLGPTHEHTLGARTNLASTLAQKGSPAEAERALLDVQRDWTEAKGPEHPGTLLTLHVLSLFYMDAGRLDEAETTVRRLIEIRSRVLGDTHLDTIGALTNLGLILSRKRSPEAEGVYVRTWQAAHTALGENHPTTLTTAFNLMTLYEGAGWPASGTPHVQRLVGALHSISNQKNVSPSTLNACAWLLLTVHPESLQDPETALAAATRACDAERSAEAASPGAGDSLWEYLDTLALAYSRNGAARNAVQSQREAIRLMPATPSAQAFLAEMKERLEKYETQAARLDQPKSDP